MEEKLIETYEELFLDFMHPNPNINKFAATKMRKVWPQRFKKELIGNLESDDLLLRRRSVMALGEFDADVMESIVHLYLNTESDILKVSCLKVLIKVIVNKDLHKVNQNIINLAKLAIENESPLINLMAISLLRQIGDQGIFLLLEAAKDQDLLKSAASRTAISEIQNHSVNDLFPNK